MDHSLEFRDLCYSPRWLIDDISFENLIVRVSGWALTPYGEDHQATILLNGTKPTSLIWNASSDLLAIFPFPDIASKCRFSTVYELATIPDVFKFSYVGAYLLTPFNRWTDIYYPYLIRTSGKLVTPESSGMKRTQGHDSLFRFTTYGYTISVAIDLTLQTYFGINLKDCSKICDWGVGCGRVAQMVHELAPESQITGLDIDAENVDWCSKNLSFGRYKTIDLYPPAGVVPEFFDLVYGISVFSHLTLDAAEMWIEELARILKSGGIGLFTINSGPGLGGLLANHPSVVRQVLQSGYDASTHDAALDNFVTDKEYYRATFMTRERAVELFSKMFTVRDILPQANASSQDLVVCEKL